MDEKDFKTLVIEKAKEIFKTYGYKKTIMEDIAKACHKSKGLIYHHYKSKEEIFRIIVNNEISQLFYILKKINGDDISVKEKFNNFFIAINDWLNDNANMYHKIITEIFDYIAVIKDIIEKFHNELLEILKNILKEGVDKNEFSFENIEKSAISILQMIFGFMYTPFKQILNLNINNDPSINNFIDIIYNGIEKR